MQVTELESSGLKKQFKVTVEAQAINAQTEAELKSAGERVKMPGFRPGFIPLKVLKQRYGKSVQADVMKQVINRATSDVLSEKKLRPAMTPQVNIEDYQEGGDLVFTMAFDAFPEVPEIDFSAITLARKTFDIEDGDIDKALERIAGMNPKLSHKDGAAETDDVVVIDFTGMIDGKAFEGGSAADFRLTLGSKQFIDGFEDQLIGAKAGEERTVNVTFPADYPTQHLAGQAAVFEVKVNEVLGSEPGVMDEEFAKSRGLADLRALREAVRNQLIKEYGQIVRNELKKQLFDELDNKHAFEVPQSMFDVEFNSIWERLQQAQAQGDSSGEGKSEEELREEYRQIAKRRVKLGILLADVGTRNHIQISREELTRAVMQQAGMFPGQEKKIMDFYRSNPERMDDLRGPILEEKAVDAILAKVTFNDTKVLLSALSDEEDEETEEAPVKKKKAKAAEPATENEAEASPKKAKPAAKKKAAIENSEEP